MKDHILRSFSYIFHPIIMPLLGVIFYFSKTRRYIPESIVEAKVFSILILTVVLPILLYFLLKTLKKITGPNLETVQERVLPLLISCGVTLLILFRVFPITEIEELYFFFLAVLISTMSCLILAKLGFKASIHMLGCSGFLMFVIALSLHFKINFNGTIALMSIISGAVATSRLHMKAHTVPELIIGILLGMIPQLILLNYWL
ncbi:MAG: hypothetical protein BM564_06690 [Bacteroidetes bacterium MedPE-SWsnd-G2]|nr:MAG: hypothetical protein BM564_06690 [Bacteroidetes bacterium MedPE-SWsnd-G2]